MSPKQRPTIGWMSSWHTSRVAVITAGALRSSGDQIRRLADRLSTEPVAEPAMNAPRTLADPFSGCVDGQAFTEALNEALSIAPQTKTSVGVIAVDIDHFTALIASHGADAGADVLAAVAERLQDAVRPADLVSRAGTDAFAVLWRARTIEGGEPQTGTIVDVANRLARRFDAPISTGIGELRITVSTGTAAVHSSEASGTTAETLIQHSKTAVSTAKAQGHSQIVAFDLPMQEQAVERYRTETELRAALHDGSLGVHFQPIVNLHTGGIVALEALARWHHGTAGQISPELFIPIAEESGLINELGRQVMDATVRQSAQWNRSMPSDILVTMNLSGRQLLDQTLIGSVSSLLEAHSLEPGQLCLEITESVVMNDVAKSMTILGHLKDLGVCLAIDDFGTGYSSLSYLRRLPVDILKIDRSFVQGIQNRDDRMIAKAIIDLAHTLGMTTIAEGVETRMQVEVLHALNCDMAQGFLLHVPTAAADIDFSPIDFSTQAEFTPLPVPTSMLGQTII